MPDGKWNGQIRFVEAIGLSGSVDEGMRRETLADEFGGFQDAIPCIIAGEHHDDVDFCRGLGTDQIVTRRGQPEAIGND